MCKVCFNDRKAARANGVEVQRSDEHRTVDGVETKHCPTCKTWKALADYNTPHGVQTRSSRLRVVRRKQKKSKLPTCQRMIVWSQFVLCDRFIDFHAFGPPRRSNKLTSKKLFDASHTTRAILQSRDDAAPALKSGRNVKRSERCSRWRRCGSSSLR
jgi:hypothetical protein